MAVVSAQVFALLLGRQTDSRPSSRCNDTVLLFPRYFLFAKSRKAHELHHRPRSPKILRFRAADISGLPGVRRRVRQRRKRTGDSPEAVQGSGLFDAYRDHDGKRKRSRVAASARIHLFVLRRQACKRRRGSHFERVLQIRSPPHEYGVLGSLRL